MLKEERKFKEAGKEDQALFQLAAVASRVMIEQSKTNLTSNYLTTGRVSLPLGNFVSINPQSSCLLLHSGQSLGFDFPPQEKDQYRNHETLSRCNH
jgi:hypothetical protein